MADNEKIIRVQYTIEPHWASPYTSEISIAASELEGLEGEDRDKAIQDCVADAVSNDCSWGWIEL
jgi:hypothetical protein